MIPDQFYQERIAECDRWIKGWTRFFWAGMSLMAVLFTSALCLAFTTDSALGFFASATLLLTCSWGFNGLVLDPLRLRRRAERWREGWVRARHDPEHVEFYLHD